MHPKLMWVLFVVRFLLKECGALLLSFVLPLIRSPADARVRSTSMDKSLAQTFAIFSSNEQNVCSGWAIVCEDEVPGPCIEPLLSDKDPRNTNSSWV